MTDNELYSIVCSDDTIYYHTYDEWVLFLNKFSDTKITNSHWEFGTPHDPQNETYYGNKFRIIDIVNIFSQKNSGTLCAPSRTGSFDPMNFPKNFKYKIGQIINESNFKVRLNYDAAKTDQTDFYRLYKKNKYTGKYISYHCTGMPHFVVTLVNGEICGNCLEYDPIGRLVVKKKFDDCGNYINTKRICYGPFWGCYVQTLEETKKLLDAKIITAPDPTLSTIGIFSSAESSFKEIGGYGIYGNLLLVYEPLPETITNEITLCNPLGKIKKHSTFTADKMKLVDIINRVDSSQHFSDTSHVISKNWFGSINMISITHKSDHFYEIPPKIYKIGDIIENVDYRKFINDVYADFDYLPFGMTTGFIKKYNPDGTKTHEYAMIDGIPIGLSKLYSVEYCVIPETLRTKNKSKTE